MKKRLIAVLCFIASMFFLPMQNVSAVLELPYFGYIPIVHYATGRNQRFPDEYIEIQNREIQKIQRWREEAEEEYYEEQLLNHLGEVQALLDRVVAEQMEESYNEDVLKAVLPDLLKAWATKGSDSLTVLLPEASLDRLQAYIKGKLVSEMKKGLELKPDRNLSSGFRISERDGSAYYDFSADSVAELVSMYLGPQLAEIIRASAKNI